MKLSKFCYVISILLFSISFSAFSKSAKDLTPIEAFAGGVDFGQVKISPTGKYLSVVKEVEGQRNLFVLTLSDYKIINMLRFPEGAEVGNYYWVNDERIVLSKIYRKPWTEVPTSMGELYAINADGSKGKYLAGYLSGEAKHTRIRKQKDLRGFSSVLDLLPDDPNYILVRTQPWVGAKDATTVVYKMHVLTGLRRKVAASPIGQAGFLADKQGNVRVTVSSKDSINLQMYTRAPDSIEWEKSPLTDIFKSASPLAFGDSPNELYLLASKSGEPEGIYLHNLETKETKEVFKDPRVSPTQVWIDDNSRDLYAVEIEDGYPTYAFIQPNHSLALRLKSLIQALGGQQVQLVSTTRDNSMSIVRAFSDTNPGTYYLYRAEDNNVVFLFNGIQAIKPELMSPMKPIEFEARDGLKITGYLTVPKGKEAKDLPLVVMPHGGPHGPRDYWGYDTNTQVLVSRGIAVLTVNFRGSGGFGKDFEEAGYLEWGRKIQYDIIDGVKHVVEQGIADSKNMCIMGASFGGYSALQSAILEPDMFKCAIGIVGVYDLPLLYSEGDVAGRRSGQRYLSTVIGKDDEMLKAYSPSYNIDKLKAPVLIVHGGNDQRAPIEQAESLIKALKKENHPYTYELLENEGHNFYKADNRVKQFNQILNFLDKHLEL